MDYLQLIYKHYPEDGALRRLLLVHSRSVTQKALQIAMLHPRLCLNLSFIEEAAMLHDIGICQTDAPGIYCHGTHPYICHGILGAAMLRAEGLERHARVCERHTGAGLSLNDIVSQGLPFLTATSSRKPWRSNSFVTPTSSSPSRTRSARRPRSRHGEASPNSGRRA